MMVDIVISNDRALIFKAEDAVRLRRDHRIVAALIGCLPRAPRQNCQLGLPLQLLPEEAELLREKRIARLVQYEYSAVPVEERQQAVDQFNKRRDELYWKQNDLFKEDRRRKIVEMADTIVEGKRRKLLKASNKSEADVDQLPVVDRDEVLRTELGKVDDLVMPKLSSMIQLFTAPCWEMLEVQPSVWTFPVTVREKLRYAVFKDLWEKGNYLTTGGKFGGDFLVYPGDPVRYHAQHVAICVLSNETVTGREIVTMGRLGTVVKKNILLCSRVSDDGSVSYLSLRWTNE